MAVPTGPELDYIQSGVQGLWFATTVFVLVYVGLNRRWWKNHWAQMIVSLDMCLWLVDLPNCLRMWFNFNLGSAIFAWYYGTSLWLTTIVIFARAGLIVYIQLTRDKRAKQRWEATSGQVSESQLAGASSEHEVRRDEEPSTLRPPHPGGDGVGN